ncbi:MAG TPA: HAD-IIIC family phosphatase [Rubrivivax sp.]|nr:HAD-IIIC family phosphatase [Rubrivivax sp.]
MAKDPFDALLQIDSLGALNRELAQTSLAVGPLQLNPLLSRARELAPAAATLRIGIVHTYTSDLLDPWFELAAALQQLRIDLYHAPYGLALQEAAPNSALVAHRPDITLLLLRRADLVPALESPFVGDDPQAQAALRDSALRRLQDIVAMFRAQPVGHLVVSLLPGLAGPALGLYDVQFERGEAAWWAAFKTEAAGWMREHVPSSLYLDLDEVQAQVGRDGFFDRRYWYSATFPFAAPAAREITRRVVTIGVSLRAPKAKVIVLDADNTLWGGIVGEDGPHGIALGPEYPGKVYVDFQRRLLDFRQRGFLLAMCSKNNEADVLEVLRDHPHQVLRESHFAARRVNWEPKPDNIESLALELNLGLESFVFVDDSDHECAAVRHHLPQVEVIQVPKRALDVPLCLDCVARLEILSLTSEDLAKSRMYEQERQRRALGEDLAGSGGAPEYLARLGMRMTLRFDPSEHVARLSQLSGKTNQFNLTTRRYSEHQMRGFIDSGDTLVADFSLADTFGDSGVVGLAIWRRTAADAVELDTFLMSCRVIGREAESAFLHAQLRHLQAQGVRHIVANYLQTAKNGLAKDFLPVQGFEADASGRFEMDLSHRPPRAESEFPISVTVAAPAPAH